MKGKFVKIINTESVFSDCLGRYGLIVDKAYDDKWLVEFNSRVGKVGGWAHTIKESDFELVGEAIY